MSHAYARDRSSSARETLVAYVSATYDARRLHELPHSVWQDRCCSDAELFVADDVVRLMHAYAQAAPAVSVTGRLSLLMEINRYDDPRVGVMVAAIVRVGVVVSRRLLMPGCQLAIGSRWRGNGPLLQSSSVGSVLTGPRRSDELRNIGAQT